MVYLLPLTIITTDFSLVSFLRKHFNRQIIAGKLVKVKFQKSCRSLSLLSKILFNIWYEMYILQNMFYSTTVRKSKRVVLQMWSCYLQLTHLE